MTLTDAVRERLTDDVFADLKDAIAFGSPYGLAKSVLLAALAPVLEQAQGAQTPTCVWTLDDITSDDGLWQTQCGHTFQWFDDGPKENHATFCLYCGKTLVEFKNSEHIGDDAPADPGGGS